MIIRYFTLGLFITLHQLDYCQSSPGVKISLIPHEGSASSRNNETVDDSELTDVNDELIDVNEKFTGVNKKLTDVVNEKFITLKLSDLLKLSGYDPESILSSGKSGDFSKLRKIRTMIRQKLQGMISLGCMADLLYMLDSLLEYSIAQYDLSNQCVRNRTSNCTCAERVQSAIDENSWALDVIDSFGKFPAGFGKGNFWMLGDYEECTETLIDKDPLKHKWEGRYSRVDLFLYKDKWTTAFLEEDHKDYGMFQTMEGGQFLIPLPSHKPECNVLLHFKLGTCFPKTCTKSDVQTIVQYVIDIPQKLTGRKFVCDTDLHYHEELDIRKDFGSFVTMLFVLFLISLMIFGTFYDYFVYQPRQLPLVVHSNDEGQQQNDHHVTNDHHHHQPIEKEQQLSEYVLKSKERDLDNASWFIKLALAFSVYTNAKKVFALSQSHGHINCLHGIRAVSMLWVIWGHTYACGLFYIDNPTEVFDLSKDIFNQLILNATISVDAFYVLSGMLMVILWMKNMEKHRDASVFGWKGWLAFYVHRYLRLTPVYALVMVINVFLVKYFTDGPLWNQHGFEPNQCANSWWTNLLYVNNFFGQKEACMVWTWYLANDMQFYVLSPPLLMILWTSHVAGLAVIILLIFATSVIRAVIIMSHDLWPPISIIIADPEKISIVEEFTKYVYVRPYCRCGPFLVGLLLGFVLYKTQLRVHMPKWAAVVGWLTAVATGFGVLFGLYDYSKTGYISLLGKFLYSAFGRTLWGCVVAWIIFACSTGYGGIVNKFLSCKLWMPFSRLVYCAYLIHPILMLTFYSSQMKPLHFDGNFQAMFYFFGHVIVTFFFAFWLHLAFEVPLQGVDKIFTKFVSAPPPTAQTTNQRSTVAKNSINRHRAEDLRANQNAGSPLDPRRIRINDKADIIEQQQNSRV